MHQISVPMPGPAFVAGMADLQEGVRAHVSA